MLKSSIRNMEREDIEICQFTSKMIYDVIYVAGSRSIRHFHSILSRWVCFMLCGRKAMILYEYVNIIIVFH